MHRQRAHRRLVDAAVAARPAGAAIGADV